MNSLSSHVLDTTNGKPASGMQLTLSFPNGDSASFSTDDDGRCNAWNTHEFTPGSYCIRFHCKAYLEALHGSSFYPFVDIHFDMTENGGHYHVPLLISPYGFSSYRGS